jgi:hypothetical protein
MKLVQRGKIKTNSNKQMDGDRDKRRERETVEKRQVNMEKKDRLKRD